MNLEEQLQNYTNSCKVELDVDLALKQLEEHRKQVLLEKSKEYSIGKKNSTNFTEGSALFHRLTGDTISSVNYLIALMCKHLVSIDHFNEVHNLTKHLILEKFGDALNYLELLREIALQDYHSSTCSTAQCRVGTYFFSY